MPAEGLRLKCAFKTLEPDLVYTSVGKWLQTLEESSMIFVLTSNHFSDVRKVVFLCRKRRMAVAELHAISTGRQSMDDWVYISLEIHNFVDYLHLREKKWTKFQKIQAVERLLQEGVPNQKIIVNNEPDIVEKFQLGGVHFPEKAGFEQYRQRKNWRLGVSVHDEEQAVKKENLGADYLFFGHVFPTGSKPGIPPKGLSSLQTVIQSVSCPVIAIGGITPDRAAACLSKGAAGVAVLSGIYEAAEPSQSARAYQAALRGLTPKGRRTNEINY